MECGTITIIGLQLCHGKRHKDSIMKPDLSGLCNSHGDSLDTQGLMNFRGENMEKSQVLYDPISIVFAGKQQELKKIVYEYYSKHFFLPAHLKKKKIR